MHMPYQAPMRRTWLICVQMPETRSDNEVTESDHLDINFIIQKNKYEIQNLKSILSSK